MGGGDLLNASVISGVLPKHDPYRQCINGFIAIIFIMRTIA